MKFKSKFNHFTLHSHIMLRVILLTLFVGGTISLYNYHQTTELIRSAANNLFDQTRHEIELEFQHKYAPIAQTVNLLTYTSLGEAETLEQRLQHLPMLVSALSNRPELTAIEAGYSDGDFFIVRVLNDQHMREVFNAPAQATLSIDNIEHDQIPRKITRVFFDQNLNRIGKQILLNTDYDPRGRPWFTKAQQNPQQGQLTEPYLYYFIRKVGVTYAQQSQQGNAIIAADIALDMLSTSVRQQRVTPNSHLLILDQSNKVLAYNQTDQLIQDATDNKVRLKTLQDFNDPLLQQTMRQNWQHHNGFSFELNGEAWQGQLKPLTTIKQANFKVLLLTPEKELFSSAQRIQRNSSLITLLLLLIAIPLAWSLARKVSKPLYKLARHSVQIQHFNLDSPVHTESNIKEVADLSVTMNQMQSTIQQFLRLVEQISAEQNYEKLLKLITLEIQQITASEGAILYLADNNQLSLGAASLRQPELKAELPPKFQLAQDCLLSRALSLNSTQQGVLAAEDQHLLGKLCPFYDCTVNVIAIPLKTRRGEQLGVLGILIKDDSQQNTEQHLSFTEALAHFASMALESRLMAKNQQDMMQAFIQLIAGAIDAKSPYTGSHCQKVPVLTKLLTQAACDSDKPAFKGFSLTDQQWEELHIASWLHDCGKVTTPEYVVDKATKLETIYDRIHEVRMRFEVLKRDAEVNYWQQRAEQGEDRPLTALQQELEQLDQEFAFIAECNIGGEFMDDDSLERLRVIGQRKWKRTLSDRIGISQIEFERRNREGRESLPAMEPLLADKTHHLINRPYSIPKADQERFNLQQTEHLFNYGEIYNLSIRRGTLTNEERYIINDHMVQTILMLEQLPYPKHLQNVPLIAGGHHEKMDGTGYPLGIKANQLPLASRAMALADIFEALTACDRPYKKAKTVSEALRIMSFMSKDGHIDPDLFELFLESGIFLRYAESHLQPSQLGDININDYLLAPAKQPKAEALSEA
ncbi:MAG: HD domain-containing phosphohydrolase [Amphritea sp.]